jgi:hypothetical protein
VKREYYWGKIPKNTCAYKEQKFQGEQDYLIFILHSIVDPENVMVVNDTKDT